jgi:hypothetical protein
MILLKLHIKVITTKDTILDTGTPEEDILKAIMAEVETFLLCSLLL